MNKANLKKLNPKSHDLDPIKKLFKNILGNIFEAFLVQFWDSIFITQDRNDGEGERKLTLFWKIFLSLSTFVQRKDFSGYFS